MNRTKALVRLFNAFEGKPGPINVDLAKQTMQHGYLIAGTGAELISINEVMGPDSVALNQGSLHKSWDKIANCDMFQLVAEQAIHYITTYGFQSFGVYSDDTVYIPNEHLNVPGVSTEGGLRFTVIRAWTQDQILDAIISMIGKDLAMSDEVVTDLAYLFDQYIGDDRATVLGIANRELRTNLCALYSIPPQEPVDFLRYVIGKLTGSNLLIKNAKMVGMIKGADAKELDRLMQDAPANMESIFLRFKPLFLAMKSISRNKTYYNRLRKMADKAKVNASDYAGSITGQIKHGTLDTFELQMRLENMSTVRIVRLARALGYRVVGDGAYAHQIRNGKAWVREESASKQLVGKYRDVFVLVYRELVSRMRKNVEGKTYYIPAHVTYPVVATGKQFVGNIPVGTVFDLEDGAIAGIHWEDVGEQMTDLDLSIATPDGKYGWDGSWRRDQKVLFSGDVTSARVGIGASEFFRVKGEFVGSLMVNHFNAGWMDSKLVPAHIVLANTNANLTLNHVVDPNEIVVRIPVTVEGQMTLGYIQNDDSRNTFVLGAGKTGQARTFSDYGMADLLRRSMRTNSDVTHGLSMNRLLKAAGATVVDEPSEDAIDLSPESLSKSSLLDLVA